MSFRSWVYVFALGIIAAPLAWFSWAEFSSYQQSHADERIDAAKYYSEATKGGVDSCNAIMNEIGVFRWLGCLAEDVSADGSKKQSEYDLNAQQDMAEWAFGMFIVTCWLTVITFGGVALVWRTLVATQAMARDTAEMTRDARRIGEAQTRAYVSVGISPMPGQDYKGQLSGCGVTVRNIGNSPATEVEGSLIVKGPNGSEVCGRSSFNAISRGESENFGAMPEKTNLANLETILFVVHIHYNDAFRKRRFVKAIYSVTRNEFLNNFQITAKGGYRT